MINQSFSTILASFIFMISSFFAVLSYNAILERSTNGQLSESGFNLRDQNYRIISQKQTVGNLTISVHRQEKFIEGIRITGTINVSMQGAVNQANLDINLLFDHDGILVGCLSSLNYLDYVLNFNTMEIDPIIIDFSVKKDRKNVISHKLEIRGPVRLQQLPDGTYTFNSQNLKNRIELPLNKEQLYQDVMKYIQIVEDKNGEKLSLDYAVNLDNIIEEFNKRIDPKILNKLKSFVTLINLSPKE